MSDVTAQAFRDRAELFRRYVQLNGFLPDQAEVAAAWEQDAALMDAAAEQREQLDAVTAERDEARQLLEQVRKWAKAFVGYAVSHNAVSGYFDKLWSILYVAEETPDAK